MWMKTILSNKYETYLVLLGYKHAYILFLPCMKIAFNANRANANNFSKNVISLF